MLILLLLFIIPFLASAILFTSPFSAKNQQRLAIGLSLIPLAILGLYFHQLIGTRIDYVWLSFFPIHFHLSIDALSFIFLVLTAIVIPLSIFAVDTLENTHIFYGLILFLQGLVIGFFLAADLLLFTIFWEAMLFPLFFIMVLWGKSRDFKIALKFLTYMIAGSIFMLLALLALYSAARTFDLQTLTRTADNLSLAPLLCGIFVFAFAVKTPLFPFHGWLPDTYYEAPTSGTILLSALLSKAGIYGFLRISIGLFPTIMENWSPALLVLSLLGVFYGGLSAWAQNDFKRLVAYSSFSHVNFIMIGLFTLNSTALSGAILQSLNHSITITALFLAAGWLAYRLGSTSIGQASGFARYAPKLTWITFIFILSSIALPGTNSFVGELLILFGLFEKNFKMATFLTLAIILSALYMLRWMQKVFFGNPSPVQVSWTDLKRKEFAIALILTTLIFGIGIYPKPLLAFISSSENSSKLEEKR